MSTVSLFDSGICLLWDFDGTLVETLPLWREAIRGALRRHGGVLSEDEVERVLHSSDVYAADALAQAVTDGATPATLIAELGDGVLAGLELGVPWAPGGRRLLAEARAAGLPCALVTNSPLRVIAPALAELPPGTFAHLVTAESVEHPKPAGDPYARACELFGVDPTKALAIEDSPTGVRSAMAAGVQVVMVGDTPSTFDVPRLSTLERISLDQLLTLIQRSRF